MGASRKRCERSSALRPKAKSPWRSSTRRNSKRAKTTSSDELLPVGRIAGAFGIRGELKCDPTNAGRMLFSRGASFDATLADGSKKSVTLAAVRDHKNRLVVAFEGVDSANAAESFIGATLYAARERIDLADGEYLDIDLVGCALESVSGSALGIVERVEHYPSSDMLVVNGRMVPMVGAFIKSVDVRAKRIVVDVPPGLLDDDETASS